MYAGYKATRLSGDIVLSRVAYGVIRRTDWSIPYRARLNGKRKMRKDNRKAMQREKEQERAQIPEFCQKIQSIRMIGTRVQYDDMYAKLNTATA